MSGAPAKDKPANNTPHQAISAPSHKRGGSADSAFSQISASEAHEPWDKDDKAFDEAKRKAEEQWEDDKDSEVFDDAKQQTRVKHGAYEQFTTPDGQKVERRIKANISQKRLDGKKVREEQEAERERVKKEQLEEFDRKIKFERENPVAGGGGEDDDGEDEWEDAQ
ncbi:hypothetical protein LTR85_005658 [Meristemomyces frigidus]|nr:hypothetical protein LTR85_005658 [Meristemomyces frigidus]